MPEDPLNTTPPPATDAPPATPVSPDAIEAANVANILGQLAAGKPITAAQQKLVTDYQRRLFPPPPADPIPTPRAPAPPRPRPTAADITGQVADTMAAASAMTGHSEENLSRAKAAGCPAFRGSRVYLGELVAWIEANPEVLATGDDALDAVQLAIASERHRKLRFENDVAEGRYIPAADIAPRVEQFGRDLLAILRRVLEDESPRRLAGREEAEVREINRQLVDAIADAVRTGTRQLTKTA